MQTIRQDSSKRERKRLVGLEASALSASTSLLELAALGDNVGLLVGVGTSTKVLVDLSCVLWSSEEDGVATLWCSESELVEGEALSTGSFNTLTSGSGESECSDAQLLLEVDESDIVGDGSNENNGVLGGVGLAVRDLSADSADTDGSAVGSGHIQSLEDDLVELAVRSSGEESVEFHEESQVRVLRFWCGPVALLDMMVDCLASGSHCPGRGTLPSTDGE